MRVGAEIQSICGRCGQTWHVVIALAQGRIARVECLECRARHRHRAPAGGDPAAGEHPRGVRRLRAPARPVIAADPSRPSRPFRTRDTYRVGDRIVHASFGEGVVQALNGPRKVEVLFDTGAKTLVHGRKER